MADVHSKKTRSYNMSQIKGKDTKPEILVRKFLFSRGLRYRLHDKRLPGKPDLVFPRYKKVVFVHGCFWHGHEDCKYFVPPKTRTDWWMKKIGNNIERDKKNLEEIKKIGWECELRSDKKERRLSNLLQTLKKPNV
jgi:DNA mismatch endonuclease (patch repair protein)